jgi:hypothetical protein
MPLPGEGAAPTDLVGVLDRLAGSTPAEGSRRVTVHDIIVEMGERSFGPLLLIPALIGLSPIGAIPGVPAITSAIIFLIAAQILLGLRHFWLPGFLAQRSVTPETLAKAVRRMRPIARFTDRFLAPRLSILTDGVFRYIIAAMCLLVAFVTPVIELVPLAGIIPNAALAAFALAITARDGVWALLAYAFTGGCVWFLLAL